MHVITDENGNIVHSHHAHPHTHLIEHTHEHVHEEGHENEHDHEHGGNHTHSHDGEECGHAHSHACAGACDSCAEAEDETLALVSYMLQHNKHHAMELDEMAKKLRSMGKGEAADQIEKGVSEFESGNVRLEVALSLLKADK